MHNVSDMAVFVEIAQSGGLSAAGRKLGLAPSVISDRLKGLEARLGVQLLSRSTRSQTLTDAGTVYLKKAVDILEAIAVMESEVVQELGSTSGSLRITSPIPMGRRLITPFIASFSQQYPGIQIQLTLDDQFHDIVGDGYDIAIRGRPDQDSQLLGQWLFDTRRVVVASPAYLHRSGTPQSPDELGNHCCLAFNQGHHGIATWRFGKGQEMRQISVNAGYTCTDSEVPIEWALAGLGLTQKSHWEVVEHLSSGRLVEVLKPYEPDPAAFYAIHPVRYSQARKVEVFIEAFRAYLANKVGE